MDKLQANLILEILGRPKEHILEALNQLVVRLSNEQGIKVIEKKFHNPIEVENSKDLFTTFAEVLVELESIENYLGLMFGYMPSNIELINPEKITFTNADFNELSHKLISRLHDYDAITKKALIENEILAKKMQEINHKPITSKNSANKKQPNKKKTKKSR